MRPQLRVRREAGAQSLPRAGDHAGFVESEHLVGTGVREEAEHAAVSITGTSVGVFTSRVT